MFRERKPICRKKLTPAQSALHWIERCSATFRAKGGAPGTNAAGPSVGAGAAEGGSAMSIPEGMIANNLATTPCRGLSLSC
jgi:hypothetical protein